MSTSALPIRLVVGLGNPGNEYIDTRHNAGFWWVDALARELGVHLQLESKFHGLAARSRDDVWLLQPTTYMNRSGQSVAALARFYKIPPEAILVVHDELDLLPGEAKLKQGGSHAGHNGLKDIQALLGTANFWRLRLGVGHPRTLNLNQSVVDFVLQRPRQNEQPDIEAAIERSLKAWPLLAAAEFPRATMAVNTKPKAAKPAA
ncbi:aminoacyl-tRNA hydrolase [Chitinimonas taiwanensis]|jgi:PTH1 family peptidyl-tRNA hydrolase|uniref:Peptidyl-tRNA hydrolase n=1 Tax=Chitinimonas taiwanensis DSM 18899 TaxID=1121279 RepID=A0A1K2HH98_9NEIS|nr:aminoacyl-tRNA hydrolase [Chitinimonas taiwanensis]SFZ76101.1 peptidyl-tRNA hydrolase, PTH1 family [Chitinimonas taiwanensis DSM 18899]